MRRIKVLTVTLLTFYIVLTLQGCAFIGPHAESLFQESCQSHAYAQTILTDYIQGRFVPGAPVRVGVLTASVPPNMSFYYSLAYPDVGVTLSNRIQQDLLNYGELPIVELFNRPEWPGKRDEFYSGNFGAIRSARDAGYDIVVIPFLLPMTSLDKMSALTRVIDTASGNTIFYGKITSSASKEKYHRTISGIGLEDEKPDENSFNAILDKLGQCVSQAIMKDSTTPK